MNSGDRHDDRPGPPDGDWSDGRPRPEDSVLRVWRGLLANQVSFVRELWEIGSKAAKDPSSLRTRAPEFWSRWSSPAAWFSGAPGDRPAAAPMDALCFVIDQEAEATAERRVPLPAGSCTTGEPLRATALKNVSGPGEIPAAQVEARVGNGATGTELRVALVDLTETQRRRRARELAPGLYVGAIFSAHDDRQPLAIVQVMLNERR